jgi:predicted DNA-binding protein with PD1-like motif
MKFTEAKQGRVFVLRLEDGDILHEQVEKLAKEKGIKCATVTAVGGVDKGSKLVVGPEDGRSEKIKPVLHVLDNVHEVTGTGTIFCDGTGEPILHMHLACGRRSGTITGCVRSGVKVWQILEVVIYEIKDCNAGRAIDAGTGFNLLKIK